MKMTTYLYGKIVFSVFCGSLCLAVLMGIALLVVVAVIFYREYKECKSITKAIERLQKQLCK